MSSSKQQKVSWVIGQGFLGQQLISFLRTQGRACVGIDQSPAAQIRGDAADKTFLRSLIEKKGTPQAIFCCQASGGGTIDDYRHCYVDVVQALLDLLPDARLIFCSSVSVYAPQEDGELKEDSPTRQNDRAAVLQQAEKLVQSSGGVVARLCALYGPGRCELLRRFQAGIMPVHGAGDRMLNYLHRDDAARALILLAQKGEKGQLYNLCGETITKDAALEMLAEQTRMEIPTGERPPTRRQSVEGKLNTERLRALGWHNEYTLQRFVATLCALPEEDNRNHYEWLELDPKSTNAQIKESFRRLAKNYHPDLNQGSASATERFKRLAEAYRVLISPPLRRAYDVRLAQLSKVQVPISNTRVLEGELGSMPRSIRVYSRGRRARQRAQGKEKPSRARRFTSIHVPHLSPWFTIIFFGFWVSLLTPWVLTQIKHVESTIRFTEARNAAKAQAQAVEELSQEEQLDRMQAYIKVLRDSADKGDAEAQFSYASMLVFGRGCERDLDLARVYLKKASTQNHGGAQDLLNLIDSQTPREASPPSSEGLEP